MNLKSGEIVYSCAESYPHGVISERLPGSGVPLPREWYLQDPDDWLEVLCSLSKAALRATGIAPEQVVGIGTDFTSCTLVPSLEDGRVLCQLPEYRERPHAWPKLWKHHGAQRYAEELEAYALKHTDWLRSHFGSSVSSEWAFPKIMQIAREDYALYQRTDHYIEALDWIVLKLSGRLTRCTAALGVNAFWIKGKGYPDKAFWKAVEPRMEHVVEEKMRGREVLVGEDCGTLTPEMAARMGLTAGTVISAGHSDGAVAGCGAGVVTSGSMMMVMGTSTCHQMMYKDYHSFDGICSVAGDGMVPGLYGYECGQPAVGDIFEWYADNCAPAAYRDEAASKGISLLQLMDRKASALRPGGNGLVALDWFNGNRSILSNYNLSGTIVGLTLHTKPEEIYRALVEATQFGSRRIIENYESNGVKIDSLYAVGGLARKSPFVVQICADILGRTVLVPQLNNVPAMGAAVCAAVAVGPKRGGYADFEAAANSLIPKDRAEFKPNPKHHAVYNELYRYFCQLHDYFGRDDHLMRGLKTLSGQGA